jgi:hypothetical protein
MLVVELALLLAAAYLFAGGIRHDDPVRVIAA